MPPQAYVIGGALVWNYRRDKAGKLTISQWSRAHPELFIAGMCWLIPHVLIGSNLPDRAARAIARVRR